MEIYYVLVGILIFLAIVDLVVGVSNDAVNFLNSAIGSKAVSFKKILMVASIGVFLGAVFSSGMMEVARKSIFHPEMFSFHDIIIIFISVMLTDIILLDTFNRLGLPTSTTVSVVFELLGSAVAVSFWKILDSSEHGIGEMALYINSSRALTIIGGILLSIIVAFTVGSIIMFFSRLLFSFQYDILKKNLSTALMGGLAFAAIGYFIFLKGLKGTPFYDDIKPFIHRNFSFIIGVSFIAGFLIAYIVNKFLKYNFFKIIILMGVFSLALAFAGNDLVNFIGVPIAAYNSLEFFLAGGGTDPLNFTMEGLSGKVPTPTLFLILAGIIMVLTLWFSKKAMRVSETEISLASQGFTDERFTPNILARSIVKAAITVNDGFQKIIPAPVRKFINSRFQIPTDLKKKGKLKKTDPSFDYIRASVNMISAAILISLATSYKLPLSTTYVTFMVAMGSSLADRAWGRESAVYRIAGVISVITGWFVTAMVAFLVSFFFATLIFKLGLWMVFVLFAVALYLLYINHLKFKKEQLERSEEVLNITYVISDDTRQLLDKTFDRLSILLNELKDDYGKIYLGLKNFDPEALKTANEDIIKFFKQANKLRTQLYFLLQNLDEGQLKIGNNYIKLLNRVQDIIQSLHYISKASKDYVANNHFPLKPGQLKDLEEITHKLTDYVEWAQRAFQSRDFDSLKQFYKAFADLEKLIDNAITKQIERVRKGEVDPQNSSFFMSILTETRDLIDSFRRVIKLSVKLNKPIRKAEKATLSNEQQTN